MIYSFSKHIINNKIEGLSDKTRAKLGEFQRDTFWLSVNRFLPEYTCLDVRHGGWRALLCQKKAVC